MRVPHKVVFLIPSLSPGGAERVMTHILGHIDRTRIDPYLVLFRKIGTFLEYVPSDVPIYSLSHSKYYFIFRWLIYNRFKKCITSLKPDAVVSFMWYPNLIALLDKWSNRRGHKVIVCEHTTLTFTHEGWAIGWFRKWGSRLLYPKADRVLSLTKQMKMELLKVAPLHPDRVKVLYNPVDVKELERRSKEAVDKIRLNPSLPLVISVGRLTVEKGFKYLIRAFADVIKRHPAQLLILGEGKERDPLERLISQLGIKHAVYMPGFEKNPYKYLSHSDLFVLSSISEGFPMALIEAMALGVPCIATRCPTGPEEIITDGVNGLLVSPRDEISLAESIVRLLKDSDLRKKLSGAAKKRVEDFRVEKIVKEYEELIISAADPWTDSPKS